MELFLLTIPPLLLLAGIILVVIALKKGKEETSPGGDRVIIECENCGKRLRLPRKAKKLKVTCPSCKHSFQHSF